MEKVLGILLLLMAGSVIGYLSVVKVLLPVVNLIKQSARLK